jgi:electron transport complex protein RnfC
VTSATRLSIRTFGRGGIHPDSHKERTSGRAIERLSPPPSSVWLPLAQDRGEPATPLVAKGDLVVRGQKIADGGPGGVPIHATITGKVRPIEKRPHPTLVLVPTLVITAAERPPDAPSVNAPEDPDWRDSPRGEALDRIRDAGVVGLGGAAFPTHRKLQLPPGARVDTLIVNGAECEPYLTSDESLMTSHPAEVIEGALVLARVLGVRRVLIGVEIDKRAAVDALRASLPEVSAGEITVDVVPCEVRYPQGAERQLVAALTGRAIPPRALPYHVGVMVQNVATALAVYDAVRYRRPLLDRVVTVTGPGIREPKNVLAPIGTPLADLVNFCGGMTDDTTRLIAGGPMMGRSLPRLDLPLVKGLNGLVLLTGRGPFEEGYGPCIQCARCLDACPLGLEPNRVSVYVEASRTLETEPFGALDCYECGCCTYVCPSGRPLLQFMQVAKSALRRSAEIRSAS